MPFTLKACAFDSCFPSTVVSTTQLTSRRFVGTVNSTAVSASSRSATRRTSFLTAPSSVLNSSVTRLSAHAHSDVFCVHRYRSRPTHLLGNIRNSSFKL